MKRLVCFAVLILTLCRNTQAVIKAGDQTLTGGGGVMAPTSNVDLSNAGGGTTKVGSVGGAAYGQYLYYVTPNLGLGADINFAASGDETSTSVIPRGNTTNSFKSTLVLLMARANLSNTGTTVPYVFAGVGFHSTTLDMKTMPQPGFAWVDTGTTEQRTVVHDTKSAAAANVGIGLDNYLSDQLFIGFEGRFQYLGEATYDTSLNTAALTGVTSIKGTTSMFDFLLHIGYRFGGSSEYAQTPSPQATITSPATAPPVSQPAASPTPPPTAPFVPVKPGPDNPGLM